MKNILSISAFFCFAVFSAQSVSDYGKISLVRDFEKFPDNKFNLRTILTKSLESKHYKVVEQNPSDCNALTADVLNTSNMLRNRVTVQFKDCKNNVVFEKQGISMDKDYETGFPDALQKAMIAVPVSNPVNMAKEEVQETETIAENSVPKNDVSVTENNNQKSNDVSNIYRNNNQDFQKIDLPNDQFILVASGSSVPFATFSKTTRQDVFRVVMQDGSATLGYWENHNYVIEIPNKDGSVKREIFIKK